MSSFPEPEPWFSVRCLFVHRPADAQDDAIYEERITLWQAESFELAIARAEEEAAEYAGTVGAEYLGFAQSFHLAIEDRAPTEGDEVYSLMRDSSLDADAYISRYFDDGREHQGTIE